MEVPSIEVVAQILEELDYKPLGDHKMMGFSGGNLGKMMEDLGKVMGFNMGFNMFSMHFI